MTLAAVLLVLTARSGAVYGATGIDVNETGTITFDLPASEVALGEEKTPGQQYYKELQEQEIEVNLYKVADVDISGRYTSNYEGLDLSSVGASTTAGEWQELANTAKGIVDTSSGKIQPAATVTVIKGSSEEASRELELKTGMYLADAQEVITSEYIYRFTPFLVALPGNNYSATNSDTDDAWIYHVTVGLKPDRQDRYGDVAFEKTFLTYDGTFGATTAIFQVEAVKDNESVFSDVVTLHFNSEKTWDEYTITRLPIGAEVTIREVYSGASYTNAGTPREYTFTVDKANPKYDTPEETGGENYVPESVRFINNYNGQSNGGNSVVNHFIYKTGEIEVQDNASAGGVWDVEQIWSDDRGGAE